MFVIILLSFSYFICITNFKVKTNQMNYKDQYEQCNEGYQKMYKMMDNKLKFYVQNENNLFNSVKSTMFKAYEQNEKLKDDCNKKVSKLENQISTLENNLKGKGNDFNEEKETLLKRIKELESNLEIKSTQVNDLSNSLKVNEENLKISKENEKKYSTQAENYKTLAQKKESYYKEKLEKCSAQVFDLSKEGKETYANLSKNFTVNEEELKEMEGELVRSKSLNTENYQNQIVRGGKIKDNLSMIYGKLDNLLTSGNNSKNGFKMVNKNKNETKTNHTSTREEENFMEIGMKSTSSFSNEFSYEALQEKESLMKKKLDFILFEDLDKSRKVYQKLNEISSYINHISFDKNKCEDSLKFILSQNSELKEALAELEIKFRISKASANVMSNSK
jgi:myosin heavy subunit